MQLFAGKSNKNTELNKPFLCVGATFKINKCLLSSWYRSRIPSYACHFLRRLKDNRHNEMDMELHLGIFS